MTAARPGTPGLTAVRRWAVNWLAGADLGAATQCLAADYTLRIGTFTLSPRSAYVEATATQLERYPGLGVTVHDLVTDGRRTVVRLSEHGASVRHDGASAAWRVVAVFEHDEAVITRGWAEEDYWARRRQLASGVADRVDPPAVAPWSSARVDPDAGVEQAVRAWVEAGAPPRPGVVRDDEDLVATYDSPLDTTAGTVDVLVTSGRRVGFHAVLSSAGPDGSSVSLPAAGLVDVDANGGITGHVVTDRLGLPRSENR